MKCYNCKNDTILITKTLTEDKIVYTYESNQCKVCGKDSVTSEEVKKILTKTKTYKKEYN